MIIALNLVISILYYHLDRTPQMIIASNLVISILLSPRRTPQFMIIALNLAISILFSRLTHAAIYDYRPDAL
jgi:hypothetical protein